MKKEIHIGEEIRKKIYERDLTITEFARRINRSREAARGILQRSSINTDMLRTISDVLDYDFFQLYSKKYEETQDSHINR